MEDEEICLIELTEGLFAVVVVAVGVVLDRPDLDSL